MMELLSPQEPIQAIVERVWATAIGWPPEWTTEQQQAYVASETSRIETLIDEAMPGQGPLLTEHQRTHGTSPDYLTTVQMINQSRAQVTEMILAQELYSQIPDGPDLIETDPIVLAEQQKMLDAQLIAQHRSDPQRWMKLLHSNEPTPQIAELTQRLWGDQSTHLKVLAERLMQARSEDGQALPTSPTDPLFQEFTSLLDQALISKGRQHDTYRPPTQT
ncbi:MAG: hypothetical protein WAW85_16870 [Gordonia sp. (in: high G+C Gram-positive bacteria)]|uniref:hypothetical protein n=1 Tax=Gordonia sp. (in: high G+C Gram-positive bacteria) TaxID=84139 RepID=UPI003BB80593